MEMSAASTRTSLLPTARQRGLAERLAIWILARSERRHAEELERLAWDLEARHDHHCSAGSQRDHHVVLPPGGGLY